MRCVDGGDGESNGLAGQGKGGKGGKGGEGERRVVLTLVLRVPYASVLRLCPTPLSIADGARLLPSISVFETCRQI